MPGNRVLTQRLRGGGFCYFAWRAGFIDKARLFELAAPLTKNEYGHYLLRIAGEKP